MTPEWFAAVAGMAELLRAENAALAALDLGRAAAMQPAKSAAADRLLQCRERGRTAATGSDPSVRQQAHAALQQLRELGTENRQLLQRAILVQGRVLATIAKAARRSNSAPRYGRAGRMVPTGQANAYTLIARV